MPLIDMDVEVAEARTFRDNDGHVNGLFVTVHAVPGELAPGADEPAFSGQSYLNLELHLDNGREATTIIPGSKLHLTVDTVAEGGA